MLKILRLSLAGSLILWHLGVGAESSRTKTFIFDEVTRKVGGEEFGQAIDIDESKLTIAIKTENHRLRIHSLTLFLESGELMTLDQLEVHNQVGRDHNGALFLYPGKRPLYLAFDTKDQKLMGLIIKAESYGGYANMIVNLGPSSEVEIPPIVPEEPLKPADPPASETCDEQLDSVQLQIGVCQSQAQNLLNELSFERSRLSNLQEKLAKVSQPLAMCKADLNKIIDIRGRLRSEVHELKQKNADLSNVIEELNIEERLSRKNNTSFTCRLKDRHGDRFSGKGKTRGQAMAEAMRACGKNGCGKLRWHEKYHCELN